MADHPPILSIDNTSTVVNSRANRASMKANLPCAANALLALKRPQDAEAKERVQRLSQKLNQ